MLQPGVDLDGNARLLDSRDSDHASVRSAPLFGFINGSVDPPRSRRFNQPIRPRRHKKAPTLPCGTMLAIYVPPVSYDTSVSMRLDGLNGAQRHFLFVRAHATNPLVKQFTVAATTRMWYNNTFPSTECINYLRGIQSFVSMNYLFFRFSSKVEASQTLLNAPCTVTWLEHNPDLVQTCLDMAKKQEENCNAELKLAQDREFAQKLQRESDKPKPKSAICKAAHTPNAPMKDRMLTMVASLMDDLQKTGKGLNNIQTLGKYAGNYEQYEMSRPFNVYLSKHSGQVFFVRNGNRVEIHANAKVNTGGGKLMRISDCRRKAV